MGSIVINYSLFSKSLMYAEKDAASDVHQMSS